MKENILFSVAGVVLGFFIGFFIANMGENQPVSTMTRAGSPARSLDPAQAGAPLPPGHPNLSGGNNAAASSAQAQTAMDAADRNPQDFTAQMKAAAAFYQLESFDKAELYLTRALALKPNDPDALTGMGHTKYDKNDFIGAATYYEKLLAQRPGDADLLADFGSTYARRQPPDYDRAIAEYRKALEIDPRHEQALARLADVSLSKGDKATAKDAIDKLAAINPSSPVLSTLRSNLNR
ncbi:MAG: tetratricopeptide repeat protein [Acidobacteria bacterium]|nr:tetratricopeptide repeat protein [Acidobacteriota bacterium]